MLDLDFQVLTASAVPFAATPLLAFNIRIVAAPETAVHTVMLRCQIQIETTRRTYAPEEQSRIVDLFGQPERWSQTLRTMLWTHAAVVVPAFTSETTVDLPVPCSFDFNVAATKYFHGLTGGDVPLRFLFSGTVFHEDAGALQAAPISWAKEATFRLPSDTWQTLMDAYYPNTAWLCLRRDVFERLLDLKTREGLPSWEQTVERALGAVEADAVVRS